MRKKFGEMQTVKLKNFKIIRTNIKNYSIKMSYESEKNGSLKVLGQKLSQGHKQISALRDKTEMKSNISPGPDELSNVVMKAGKLHSALKLHGTVQVLPLYTKNDMTYLRHYSPISLLSYI